MTLSWDLRGGCPVITVAGELDVATAPHLGDVIENLTTGPSTHLVVDLQAVTFMDCSGLHPLIAGHRRLSPDGALAVVCPADGTCGRVLELTGVSRLLNLYSSAPAALAALGSPEHGE